MLNGNSPQCFYKPKTATYMRFLTMSSPRCHPCVVNLKAGEDFAIQISYTIQLPFIPHQPPSI